MRSNLLQLSVFGSFSLMVALWPSVGCSDDAKSLRSDSAGDGGIPPTAAPSETALAETDDASTTTQYRGNPLCYVTGPGRCMPDDEVPACLDAEEDRGAEDAGPSDRACRIDVGAQNPAPGCSSEFAPSGTDGVACKSGKECAPGFECVEGDQDSVCRRYCCQANACSEHMSMNGGPMFCDVQKLANAPSHIAPVCMPLKKCKLLQAGACAARETCAIATEKGDTGCVMTGRAKVGESCDEEHCEADLTCLGSPGDRRCFKLCRTDGTDCGPAETCTTGAVFQNPTFGVCQAER